MERMEIATLNTIEEMLNSRDIKIKELEEENKNLNIKVASLEGEIKGLNYTIDKLKEENQTNLITQGFCNTNNNIEKAILAGQQNTAAIISSSAANVQKVLDKLCEQETDRLRTALAEARVVANNSAQTNELISRLSPTPTPSWIVASPYTSIYPPTPTATA